MSRVSDLVQDAELQTSFDGQHTIHVYTETGETARERAVVREEHWKRQKYIGGGAYGSVWLEQCVKGQRDLELRAVKEVKKFSQASKKADYARELEAISKFSHRKYERCFVKSLGWYETESAMFIAMEYFEHGDLHHFLHSMPPLPELSAQQITFQVLEGLHFMHTNGYAHRDLKPGNILIRSKPPNSWWVKLGDFGISKRAADSAAASSTVKGTLRYMAPELLDFIKPGPGLKSTKAQAADMWALGEITFQMLTKEPTFKSINLLLMYIRSPESFPSDTLRARDITDTGINFIKGLMRTKPKERLTVGEALRQAWVATSSAQLIENTILTYMEPVSQPAPAAPSQDSLSAPSGRWSTVSMAAPPSLPKGESSKNSDIRSFFGGKPSVLRPVIDSPDLSTSTATLRPSKVNSSENLRKDTQEKMPGAIGSSLTESDALPTASSPGPATSMPIEDSPQTAIWAPPIRNLPERNVQPTTPKLPDISTSTIDSDPSGSWPDSPKHISTPLPAKYFTIKAGSDTAIETSAAHGIWCCGKSPNSFLSNVFKSTEVPIYLIFSVKGSRQFCGVAQMKSAWTPKITVEHWETVGWEGGFEVEWLSFTTIDFDDVKHLTLKEDGRISITLGRFVLEVCERTGVKMMRRFGLADLVLPPPSSSPPPPGPFSLPAMIQRQQSSDLNSIGSLGVSALGLSAEMDSDPDDGETQPHSQSQSDMMSFISVGDKRPRDEEISSIEDEKRKRL